MKIHTHEKLVSKNSFISSQTVPSHFCHLYTKPQKPIYGPPLFYHWQQQVFKSASENTKIGQSSQRKQSNLKYTPKGACMHSHTNNNHFSFFFCHATQHGRIFLNQGSNPYPQHWEHRVLISGPSGKSNNNF